MSSARLLEHERSGKDEPIPRLDSLYTVLERLGGGVEQKASDSVDYDLDPGMLAVLTEYEEHRLRANIEQKLNLYKLRVEFDLSSIDRSLEEIKEKARLLGEIITYLPAGSAASTDTIELDILLASKSDLATLIGALGNDNVIVEQIPRKAKALSRPHAPVPSSIGTGSTKHTAQPAKSEPKLDDGAVARCRQGALAALGDADGARRHPQARPPDEHRRRAGHRAQRARRASASACAVRAIAPAGRRAHAPASQLRPPLGARCRTASSKCAWCRSVRCSTSSRAWSRQISRELGKDIRLVITGAETEIDKLIVEELSDPLMHMMRNAIDHGIESRGASAAASASRRPGRSR